MQPCNHQAAVKKIKGTRRVLKVVCQPGISRKASDSQLLGGDDLELSTRESRPKLGLLSCSLQCTLLRFFYPLSPLHLGPLRHSRDHREEPQRTVFLRKIERVL